MSTLFILDAFVRGVAVGGLLIVAVAAAQSSLRRDVKVASLFVCVCVAARLIAEWKWAQPLIEHSYASYAILPPAFAIDGAFWLFIVVSFEDWPITLVTLSPMAALVGAAALKRFLPLQSIGAIPVLTNVLGGALLLHAAFVVARGWRGDLLEARRNVRVMILGLAALLGIFEVGLALANTLHPVGSLMTLALGGQYGAAIAAAIILASAMIMMQLRLSMFGAPPPVEIADARAETADRNVLSKLDSIMAGGFWRREGLTIAALAREVGVPEHRLRRLINMRLGCRNFSQFLGAYRIEAAKTHLADPANAHKTIAEIAFGLGFGSLGPFNRAFREKTGTTPSVWRHQALAARASLYLRREEMTG